jgi:hypothetical protein
MLAAVPERPFRNWLSGVHLVKQRLSLLQIMRIEALSEPPVHGSQQFASLLRLALILPEPRHAHRGAQFPGLCVLLTGNGERALEIRGCCQSIWTCWH